MQTLNKRVNIINKRATEFRRMQNTDFDPIIRDATGKLENHIRVCHRDGLFLTSCSACQELKKQAQADLKP